MRILYLSQYYPPEGSAPAARVSELSRHWVRSGHEVTVLTGFPNHPTGDIHPDYRSRFRRMIARERLEGVEVVRTWLLPLPNRKSSERVLNYTSFCVSAVLRGLFLKRPSVLIATSPQLLVGVAGWILARLKRVPFVLEVRDIWPDAILASGVGREDSLFAKTLSAISRFLYRRADLVVVVSPAFIDELHTKWDVPLTKMKLVQNGVETDTFSPEGPLDKEVEEVGGFTVSYIGTVGYAHGLENLLDASKLLQDTTFLIVGDGADRERLEREVAGGGFNVRLLGRRPREDIPSIIRASDVCLVLLRRAENFKTVIPTKMLEFMSSGVPVVVGVDGQARTIIEEANAGIFVEPDDPEALASAVVRLHEDADLRRELGSNGRRYVVERLSREQTAAHFLRLLEDVLDERTPVS